ncbi:hypothetical protein PGB90_006761 [Kerria lacca]
MSGKSVPAYFDDLFSDSLNVPRREHNESLKNNLNKIHRSNSTINSQLNLDSSPTVKLNDECKMPPIETEQLRHKETCKSIKKKIGKVNNSNSLIKSIVADSESRFVSELRGENSSSVSAKKSQNELTQKDIEDLREYVRMDNGLPSKRQQQKGKSLKIREHPSITPKMNKTTIFRMQYIRKHSTSSGTRCESAGCVNLEGDTSNRLKELVDYYKKTELPFFKFNRGFQMRYQYNQGKPVIPSSFRKFYEMYNKPIFHIPKRLNLPRKYLWPINSNKNEISYLGLQRESEITPFEYEMKEEKATAKTKKLKRKSLGKTKRIPPKPKSKWKGKVPWNFGKFHAWC